MRSPKLSKKVVRYIVGLQSQAEKRLNKLGVMNKIPPENLLGDRTVALRQALGYVDAHSMNLDRDNIASQAIS